jgi:hypothetical protein
MTTRKYVKGRFKEDQDVRACEFDNDTLLNIKYDRGTGVGILLAENGTYFTNNLDELSTLLMSIVKARMKIAKVEIGFISLTVLIEGKEYASFMVLCPDRDKATLLVGTTREKALDAGAEIYLNQWK